jgi:Phospholipase_D-nuclease N-terminal
MARVILVLAAVGVMIYAAIDCLRSDDAEIRGLPKPLWLLVIVALPLFGGILWIVFGRQATPGRPPGGRLRTVGPDDDPDFLRSLDPRARGGDRRRKDPGRKDGDDDENGDVPAP